MSDNRPDQKKAHDYSEQYVKIRKQAETNWPAWKIAKYNDSIAVSAHVKKLVKQSG